MILSPNYGKRGCCLNTPSPCVCKTVIGHFVLTWHFFLGTQTSMLFCDWCSWVLTLFNGRLSSFAVTAQSLKEIASELYSSDMQRWHFLCSKTTGSAGIFWWFSAMGFPLSTFALSHMGENLILSNRNALFKHWTLRNKQKSYFWKTCDFVAGAATQLAAGKCSWVLVLSVGRGLKAPTEIPQPALHGLVWLQGTGQQWGSHTVSVVQNPGIWHRKNTTWLLPRPRLLSVWLGVGMWHCRDLSFLLETRKHTLNEKSSDSMSSHPLLWERMEKILRWNTL